MPYRKDDIHDVDVFSYGHKLYFPFFDLGLMCYNAMEPGAPHVHKFYQLIAVAEGGIAVNVAGVRSHGEAMSVLLVPPKVTHAWEPTRIPARCIQAFLHPIDILQYPEAACLFHASNHEVRVFTLDTEAGQHLFDWFAPILREQIAPNGMLLHARLLELLALMVEQDRTAAEGNRRSAVDLSAVLHEINTHPDRNFRIAELAARVCLSPSRFAHVFQDQIGLSPLKYIQLRKMEKAKNLLQYSAMNVSGVAASLGFSSVHYFSRMFRQLTGLSPREFIKVSTSKTPGSVNAPPR